MSNLRIRDLAFPGKKEIFYYDPKDIKVKQGFNYRDFTTQENIDYLADLKESIRAKGIISAILVDFIPGPDKDSTEIICVNGESRLRCALELQAEGVPIRVPAVQDESKNEFERLVRSFVVNTGKTPSDIESGDLFKRLLAYGHTPAEIALEVGVSARFVNHCVELASGSREVRALVNANEVTPALAVQHLKKHREKAAQTLTEAVETAHAAGKSTATKQRVIKQPIVQNVAQVAPVALSLAAALVEDEVEQLNTDTASENVTLTRETFNKLIRALHLRPERAIEYNAEVVEQQQAA